MNTPFKTCAKLQLVVVFLRVIAHITTPFIFLLALLAVFAFLAFAVCSRFCFGFHVFKHLPQMIGHRISLKPDDVIAWKNARTSAYKREPPAITNRS